MRANRQTCSRFRFTAIAISTLWPLLVAGCPARPTAQSSTQREQSLKKFLQSYEGNPTSPDERTTRYAAAFVDLRDDGTEEAIVYLSGPFWCGSGGCSSLIIAPDGSSFKVLTEMAVTQLPIRVLSSKTNGWHDLGVGVGGGGIRVGYEARLTFDGKKYPSNPTISPAQPLPNNTAGRVVIPGDTKGTPLY